MKHLISLLAFLLASAAAFANGDPVIRYSSIASAANPVPLSISEISIEQENLNITHVNGYNCFDVTYELKNNSATDFPEIHYGFPIDYFIMDESETFAFHSDDILPKDYEVGWNENLIKDISFTFNGTPLDFHASKESVREAGYIVESYDEYADSTFQEGINRRWFYTSFAMLPHSKATLNVRYKTYAKAYSSPIIGNSTLNYYYHFYSNTQDINIECPTLLNRYVTENFNILYDFSPAKHFGNGGSFPIFITIDLSNLDDLSVKTNTNDNGLYNTDFRSVPTKLTLDFEPEKTKPLNLTCRHNPVKTVEKFNEIILPFTIPESQYQAEEHNGAITLRFNQPRLITDIACDIDTLSTAYIEAEILYNDGTSSVINFKPYEYSKANKSLPALLTIIDLYTYLYHELDPLEDSIYLTPDNKFKPIQSITLTPQPSNPHPNTIHNIRLLDVSPTP